MRIGNTSSDFAFWLASPRGWRMWTLVVSVILFFITKHAWHETAPYDFTTQVWMPPIEKMEFEEPQEPTWRLRGEFDYGDQVGVDVINMSQYRESFGRGDNAHTVVHNKTGQIGYLTQQGTWIYATKAYITKDGLAGHSDLTNVSSQNIGPGVFHVRVARQYVLFVSQMLWSALVYVTIAFLFWRLFVLLGSIHDRSVATTREQKMGGLTSIHF